MLKQIATDTEKMKNNKSELFAFSQLFIFFLAIFFVINNNQSLTSISSGSVEQWMNLTQNFFYDSNDFLFSYGPLYWLTGATPAQYSKLAYWLSVIFISAYASVSWSIIMLLAIKRSAIIIPAIMIATGMAQFNASTMYLTLPFLIVVYCHAINSKNWMDNKLILISLAVFVAFSFYVRFFYGMISLLTFGSYLFSSKVLKHQYTSTVIFSIAALILYVAFGFLIFNNHENILNYTTINLQLNFGNSVDMTYDVDIKNTAYVIIALTFVCFNAFLLKSQPSLLLTVNGLLLIFVKIGFSRADHYIGYFIYPVALMSLLFAVSRNRLWLAMTIFVLGLMFTLGNISIYPGVHTLSGLKTHENFLQNHSERAAARYQQYKLPADIIAGIGQQSIDTYPYMNEYMIANKLNYRHRPSFQNYMTLTPVLDKLNADFFASDNAPEFVLWTGWIGCLQASCEVFNDFDGKYSLNEDPITTTAILSYYHPVRTFLDAQNRPMVLMRRAPKSEMVKPQEMSKLTLHFGEWVQVPNLSSGVVKLTPKLNLTLLAKIQNMFYRGEALYVSYKLSDGDIKRYRLNIINAQSGIWVSPWLNEFPSKGLRVIEVMLSTSSQHYFKDGFEASWQRYQFDNLDIKEPASQTFMESIPEELPQTATSCSAYIDTVELHKMKLDGRTRMTLTSSGWAAYSVDRDLPAERAWLTLTNGNGKRFYVPLDKVIRQDVADHFKKPGLAHSGYRVMADVTDFEGNYQIGLLIAAEGKMMQCSNITKLLTVQ